ncbi:MAG: hypothetical protein AVDCRST_MAG05-4585 [uncultured Rubrobacteraceae bacterium]|uniref:Uncharacterized protein n=1 Tax=uncultured Rubrobacteraceae bacterium TaxID=349277 RepID=A0A6J4TV15_9ACTN|nr:MAG: hypothetical protein AVDCRST_MAG05-4585 [uncultured Rubrobacteraceae bacterium]
MGMLEPDWEDVSSPHTDLRRIWGKVRFEPVEVSGSAIDHCLEALRQTRTLGGARIGCFHVPEHKVFDWFASRNRLVGVDGGDELGFARHFFSSPAVRSLFPEAGTTELPEDDMLDFPPTLQWGSPFTFEGEVAERIFQGGAYASFRGPPTRAIATARRFREAIYGERYTDVRPYTSYDRWHEWFHYVEGATWLLIDKRYRSIWLLCITDTD